MWYKVTHNWNFMRIIRLGLGLMVTIQSIQYGEYWFALVGVLLSGLAVMDMGCASGACSAPPRSSASKEPNVLSTQKEITYEEVGN